MKKHRIARRFEDQIAEDLQGRRTFASGSGFDKGDVRISQTYKKTEHGVVPTVQVPLRIEAKTTTRVAYTFKVQDWIDVVKSAQQAGENPLFAIEFSTMRLAYVLLKMDLAVELGLKTSDDWVAKTIKKSWTNYPNELLKLRQRTLVKFSMASREETLALVAYPHVLDAMERYVPEG